MYNKKKNLKIKLSNSSSFVILIFVILKFRNIGHSVVPNFDPHPIWIFRKNYIIPPFVYIFTSKLYGSFFNKYSKQQQKS